MRIAITGVGVVSTVGTSRDAFFESLATGRSGIGPHVPLGGDDAEVALSARVDDFGAKRFFDPRALRRMARLSQMALVATRESLVQATSSTAAGTEKLALPWAGERVGVVLGTGLGTLRETIEFMRGYIAGGPEQASPLLFPSSVVNAAAGQIAIELGLRGPNSTVNHRETSPLDALQLAADLVALGRADAVCVGGVDEASGPSLHGYAKLGRLTGTGVRPYAADRDGMAPGEGAAVLVVEPEEAARARGAKILAVVAGQAAAGSARARVGWSGAHAATADGAAIRAALTAADLAPSSVDWIAGAGNGTALDAIEVAALRAAGLLDDVGDGKLNDRSILGSILGQTGEFFGSAALRLAAAVYALGQQAVPGTTWGGGDPDLPSLAPLIRAARAQPVRAVLVPSFAQGGAEAAAVLVAP